VQIENSEGRTTKVKLEREYPRNGKWQLVNRPEVQEVPVSAQCKTGPYCVISSRLNPEAKILCRLRTQKEGLQRLVIQIWIVQMHRIPSLPPYSGPQDVSAHLPSSWGDRWKPCFTDMSVVLLEGLYGPPICETWLPSVSPGRG
jgi:hypothetical protein